MNVTVALHAIEQYGLILVFLIVLMEYLNLPGLPAGVILPFSGAWAAKRHLFLIALAVTIIAGIVGSILLYWVGKYGGSKLVRFCVGKSARAQKVYDSLQKKIEKQGFKAIFVSKLLPVVRTLIGIPAGAMKMDFVKYVVSSALGIVIWNGVLFTAGYFLGAGVFQ